MKVTDDPTGRRPDVSSKEAGRPILPLSVVVAVVGILVLSLAIADEPLHIDELQQAGFYQLDLEGLMDGAVFQGQPPLHYLIGASLDELFGPSNLVYRLPGATFGFLAGIILMALSRGRRWGWLTGLLLFTAPVFLEFSAYSRPYGLPLLLMVTLVFSTQRWERTGSRMWLLGVFVVALLLPFSRTTEPPVFLVGYLLTLFLVRHRFGHAAQWTHGPMVAALAGLVATIPILRFVSGGTAAYRSTGVNDLRTAFGRIIGDIGFAHASRVPFGWVLGIVGTVGFAVVLVRFLRGRSDLWWGLPIGFVALAMPLVFALLAQPDQPYWPRYTYFFMPLFALGALALVEMASHRLGHAMAAMLVLLGCLATVLAFYETHNPDYEESGESALAAAAGGDTVIWEWNRSLALWRPKVFPGKPIYVPPSESLFGVEILARGEASIEPGSRPIILAQGFPGPPSGWTGVDVSQGFAMWIPDADPVDWGFHEQAEAIWSACLGTHPDVGAAMCATSVRLLAEGGDLDGARSLYGVALSRVETDLVRREFEKALADLESVTTADDRYLPMP